MKKNNVATCRQSSCPFSSIGKSDIKLNIIIVNVLRETTWLSCIETNDNIINTMSFIIRKQQCERHDLKFNK